MSAFLKKNGGWLLLAVCMLTLLITLPYIEGKEVNVDLSFRVILENRSNSSVDGFRMRWTLEDLEGELDSVHYKDLVQDPLQPGESMYVDFSRKMTKDVKLPAAFHSEFAVLDELTGKMLEIVVEGTADFEAEEEGVYLFVLEGTHGSYTIHQETIQEEM